MISAHTQRAADGLHWLDPRGTRLDGRIVQKLFRKTGRRRLLATPDEAGEDNYRQHMHAKRLRRHTTALYPLLVAPISVMRIMLAPDERPDPCFVSLRHSRISPLVP